MKLLYDVFDEVFIWVDEFDENIELSPRFDEKVYAMQWYGYMSKYFKSEK